jgi:hypothetical protein
VSVEQLALEVEVTVPDAEGVGTTSARTYWEHAGPRVWRPVSVRVRYGNVSGLPVPVFPEVRTGGLAPRNVLVERADGTRDVRPVRLLRARCPG